MFVLQWTSGLIVTFGWSKSEDLVFIQQDGSVLYYDIFGTYIHSFNFGTVSITHLSIVYDI